MVYIILDILVIFCISYSTYFLFLAFLCAENNFSVLPDKVARFLYGYHHTAYASLQLPPIPLDRSGINVHGILLRHQVTVWFRYLISFNMETVNPRSTPRKPSVSVAPFGSSGKPGPSSGEAPFASLARGLSRQIALQWDRWWREERNHPHVSSPQGQRARAPGVHIPAPWSSCE